ncbi:hypothetical protein Tsubulata_036639 [Turnera subulata]|uniref:Mitochondrial transcription termination factor family protein n=1 Tax=Turnera subulata TaxID=218843 RepID=A0A9Q0GB43_9ROSI|nr:hypothetical protein Tsubulata_036639 [Turnera subulata]
MSVPSLFLHGLYASYLRLPFELPDLATVTPNIARSNANLSYALPSSAVRGAWNSPFPSKKWTVHSTAQTESAVLTDEGRERWEACREALSAFDFSVEEKDKILGKAFGHVHSPYWGEERKKEIPQYEIVSEILDYLRSLGLSDGDLLKVLKKFPEVVGCSLEHDLKTNVKILEDKWGIRGKQLRNLLLRNPKALGYNVDCKGDCIAQCTRCWARF